MNCCWIWLLLLFGCFGNNNCQCSQPCKQHKFNDFKPDSCDCNDNDNFIQPRSYLNYSSVDNCDCDKK